MTICRPCICVGALCGLLVLATCVSAEGVWVLWSESWFEENQLSPERHTDSKWEILAAEPSSETCEKARREWIRRYALVAREAGGGEPVRLIRPSGTETPAIRRAVS